MGIVTKIKKRLIVLSEGRTIFDKIKIFLWFFGFKRKLYLSHMDGVFEVRANSSDLWVSSTVGERKIRGYFNLKAGVFLDVGSNIGKYAVIIGKQLGERGVVYAFEPEKSNSKQIEKNLKLNGLRNVTIVKKACLDKRGDVNFYINDKNNGGHSLVKKTKKKVSVEGDLLDNIVKNLNIKRVDFVKIDVEGAELSVMKGAKKTILMYHPKIIFESEKDVDVKKIIELLKKWKYETKKICGMEYLAVPKSV